MTLARPLAAEALGSALLTAVVIGSGILAERLAAGNAAVALLGNAAATGAWLAVAITLLGPVSGAHFNPAVSVALALDGRFPARRIAPYAAAQIAGGLLGVALAHAMFELPAWTYGTKARDGAGQILAEAAATFALVFTILAGLRVAPRALPWLVALVIVAGYWWTASTSFANPMITLARALTDSFAGIAPASVPGFLLGQAAGALLGLGCARALYGRGDG